MILIFCIFAALLIYFSFKSFRGGFAYLNYFRNEFAKPCSDHTPFVTIIAPCKGLDEGLEENLAALLEQNYPDYEVIFVVDDESDQAVEIVKNVSSKDAKAAKKTKLVVARKAAKSSQKVENLREAVLHVSERSKVFVFVDSDARPATEWLSNLVAPLADETVGATTGYRWFLSNKPTFGSELRSMWNASIASALGANINGNFCWGGSMAMRRETFDQLDIREKWAGTLSDDFTVTRAMKAANMAVYFVPQALTASIENCTFAEMLEFTTRQMKITRVYASHLWLMSFFGSGLFTGVMLWALLIVVLSRQNSFAVWAAIATLVLVALFSIGKSWLRLMAVRLVLSEHDSALRSQIFPQLTLWLLAPPVFLFNCFAALFSRRMTWRGIRYEMVSPNETKRLN